MRIMAVDDEILALEDFEDTCRDLGISDEIVKFNNPLDALGFVATNKVDIAFLDIEMPVVKGIELAKRIKAINRNVRIIFATSYGNYALEAFGVDAVDKIQLFFLIGTQDHDGYVILIVINVIQQAQ